MIKTANISSVNKTTEKSNLQLPVIMEWIGSYYSIKKDVPLVVLFIEETKGIILTVPTESNSRLGKIESLINCNNDDWKIFEGKIVVSN